MYDSSAAEYDSDEALNKAAAACLCSSAVAAFCVVIPDLICNLVLTVANLVCRYFLFCLRLTDAVFPAESIENRPFQTECRIVGMSLRIDTRPAVLLSEGADPTFRTVKCQRWVIGGLSMFYFSLCRPHTCLVSLQVGAIFERRVYGILD